MKRLAAFLLAALMCVAVFARCEEAEGRFQYIKDKGASL